MDRARFLRIKDTFQRALALSGAERDGFLESACSSDPDMLSEVRELLEHARGTRSRFLEHPSIADGALDASRFAVDGFRALSLLGAGASGVVYLAEQLAPRREVALKVLRLDSLSPGQFARFEREAQILAALQHPGIVQVYGVGIADDRSLPLPWIAMELVRGEPIDDYVERARPDLRGLLELFVELCSAVEHAHERGIVHRDLKPSNVLVDGRGRPRVLDFGVARVLADAGASRDGRTRTGAIVGTLAYMSPEQARAQHDTLSPASDVYALGVMLFELIAARLPLEVDELDLVTALQRIEWAEPLSLRSVRPELSRDLDTILAKALAKDPARRYSNARSFAADLKAFLEGRVISARPTGTWTRARSWIRRHRALSLGVSATTAGVAFGGISLLLSARWRAEEAVERANEVQALADVHVFDVLRSEAEELWPAVPANLARLDAWIASANAVRARIDAYRSELGELRARALPYDPNDARALAAREETERRIALLELDARGYEIDIEHLAERGLEPGRSDGLHWMGAELADLTFRLTRERSSIATQNTWSFAAAADQTRHDVLSRIDQEAQRFFDVDHVMLDVQSRRATAASLTERSLDQHSSSWDEARASIADETQCPAYRGLRIAPQLGLVPLGRDKHSGLWEFAHLASGDAPRRDAEGELVLRNGCGVVLVLLPPGSVEMGLGADLHKSPQSFHPPLPAELDAFFLSKYEVTQDQWWRWTGELREYTPAGHHHKLPVGGEYTTTLLHPVSKITWFDADRELRHLALQLATEEQWEYACRAGTTTCTPFGDRISDALKHSNAPDRDASLVGDRPYDGYEFEAPANGFEPNPWGLFNMVGNTVQWVQDSFWVSLRPTPRAGDGLQQAPNSRMKVIRGGQTGYLICCRDGLPPTMFAGVRPARPLDP